MHVAARPLLLGLLLGLAGCGSPPAPQASVGATQDAHGHDEHGHDDEQGGDPHGHDDHGGEADTVHLTDAQIAAAGITLETVAADQAGVVVATAIVAADPTRSAIAAAAIGGRIAAVNRNLGEAVRRGDALAVIESREAAELTAEVEAARSRLGEATTTLEREERLFRERVSAEQDVIAARAAAREAQIRLRLAQQRLGASGGTDAATSNRLTVRAPIDGHVIERQAALGNVVAADAALFRIADLAVVSLELALSPDDAGAVAAGAAVMVDTGRRHAQGRIAFVAPIIDPATRQVRAQAELPNADGVWRIGETVTARIARTGAAHGVAVPRAAIQTVEDKPSVFVRTDEGFAVRHLVLGPAAGTDVLVTSGLAGGERIAVGNSYVLKAELGKGEGGHHDH